MQCTSAILSTAACPGLQYFSHYPINSTIKKKVIEREMYVLTLPTICLKHFSLWEEVSDIWSQMYIGLHVKYPSFLSDFNDTWIFSTIFERYKYQISWKSVQWQPNSTMLTNDKTGRHHEANSRFSQFCEHALKVQINISALHYVYAVRPSLPIKTVQNIWRRPAHCSHTSLASWHNVTMLRK
jgi:hypothetical protein